MTSNRITRFGLAAITGVAVACSFPNASLALLAFIALAPLILAARAAASWKEAFLLGEVAMMVAWLINLPWVVSVMSKYGGLPYATGVAIFVALALFVAIYGGLFALITWRLRLGSRFLPWIVLPFVWSSVEFGRTHLLTGFPWNLLGTSIVDYPQLAVASAYVGPYGVGALLVFFSAVVAWLIATLADPTRRALPVVIGAAVLLALWIGGGWLEVTRRERAAGSYTHRAAMLQPNISQEMRWDNRNLLDIFARMQAMTEEAAARGVDVVIWPESTVPLAFFSTPFFRDYVEQVSRATGTDVILGSVAEDTADPTKIWNAAYLVTNGKTEGRYDKIRLVPFGEYVPLRKMLFFAEKLVRAVGEFQFGANDKPLTGKVAYGPAICYEVVFPRIPAVQVKNGARVLVTITNDAWFGQSAAPGQHLVSARMRAIETDRYLLRAATTGISALVDPNGRIVESLELDQQGTVYGGFGERTSVTPYVRFGDWFAIVGCIITALALFVRRKAPVTA